MSSETLQDAAVILSQLANSHLFVIPGLTPSNPAIASTGGSVIIEDLAVIEASTSAIKPATNIQPNHQNQPQSSNKSKKNSSRKKSKSPKQMFRRGRDRSRSRTNSINGNHQINNNVGQQPSNNSNQDRQNHGKNNHHQQQQHPQQHSNQQRRSSNAANVGKHIKFALNNPRHSSTSPPQQQVSSSLPYVPRVYTNSGYGRNNGHQSHPPQQQMHQRPQRDRSNSESMAYNNNNSRGSYRSSIPHQLSSSSSSINAPFQQSSSSSSGNKPGQSNDFVSRQIMDYYQRNRQTNEKYKSKQILRQSLENTLKQSFPNYFVNLHIIGSTTNGIGDNVSSVDICVLARKKPVLTTVPPPSPVSNHGDDGGSGTGATMEESSSAKSSSDLASSTTPTTTTTNNDDEPITSIKNLIEPNEEKEQQVSQKDSEKEKEETAGTKVIVAAADSNTMDDGGSQSDELTLQSIEKILQTKNFAKDIVLIPARVPVIKFKDTICDLNVTLNLNQEVSIRNTQLIRDYSKMDWRFPPLATVVKQWARENHINCAVEKSISSYSWTLMVVHYLQVIEPPALPCLQRMFPKRYDVNVSIEEEMNAWRQPPGRWISKNNSTLKQLLKGFFRYYGYVFDYDQHIISVREGKVLNRMYFQAPSSTSSSSNQRLANGGGGSQSSSSFDDNAFQWNSLMCVEEPFTRTNTTRSVHDPETFERIKELLRMSSNALKGNRISLFNIIIDDIDFPNKY